MEQKTDTQPQAQTAVIVQPKREVRVVADDSAIAYLMDTAKFEHVHRIAALMAKASLIPDHLKGKNPEETIGNCFLVVNQSLRWGFDPFAVAPSTYAVRGKLGYEGKLIAAVVNTRAGLDENLDYQFNDDPNSPTYKQGAKGDLLEVTVIGKIGGVTKTVCVSIGQAKTDNQMWTKDPHQKLVYTGAVKWARRWCPEVILGVVTDDDIDRAEEAKKSRIDTPSFEKPSRIVAISDAIKTAQVDPPQDGSNAELNPTPKQEKTKRAAKAKDPAPVAEVVQPSQTQTASSSAVTSVESGPQSDSSNATDPSSSAPTVPADYTPDFDKPHESIGILLKRDGVTEEQFNAYLKKLRMLKANETSYLELSATRATSLFGNWKTHATQAKDPNFGTK